MADFKYRAYDSSGTVIEAEMAGDSKESVQRELIAKGLHPISVQKKQTGQAKLSLSSSSKLSLDDLEFLTAELSLLLKNGVKIDRCLNILAKDASGSAISRLIAKLSQALKRGEALADAMSTVPDFDSLYINLVRMGEESGQLDKVFAGLARDLKFRKELRSKITQALIYPLVIFVVCVASVLFVFNFIVPQMSGLFQENDALPLYTEMLISLSAWMQKYQLYLFIGIGLFAFGVKWSLDKGLLNRWLDENILKVPVIKNAIIQIERIRFNTSMTLMLNAGVKIDEAIRLAAGSVKNSVIRKQLEVAKNRVKRGDGLSESLTGSPIYPDFYISLLEVGEESGDLPPVFEEIASRSRDSFGNWTTRLTSLLEPLMILFMGGIVGGVVVIMLLSIMSVNDGF